MKNAYIIGGIVLVLFLLWYLKSKKGSVPAVDKSKKGTGLIPDGGASTPTNSALASKIRKVVSKQGSNMSTQEINSIVASLSSQQKEVAADLADGMAKLPSVKSNPTQFLQKLNTLTSNLMKKHGVNKQFMNDLTSKLTPKA